MERPAGLVASRPKLQVSPLRPQSARPSVEMTGLWWKLVTVYAGCPIRPALWDGWEDLHEDPWEPTHRIVRDGWGTRLSLDSQS